MTPLKQDKSEVQISWTLQWSSKHGSREHSTVLLPSQ